MKALIASFFLLFVSSALLAQNVGIGTNEPYNKLQVSGSFLVNIPSVFTNTAPTAGQTKTILNGGTVTFFSGDSTGYIYDPGGSVANYLPNLVGYANIVTDLNSVGIEITVQSMELGTGDSLIIKESGSPTANTLVAVGNGYTTVNKWVLNSRSLYIIFKSNADANTGSGFSLLFKRLYVNSSSLPAVAGAIHNALYFDAKNGAFRSGRQTNSDRGVFSTAIGYQLTASGDYSTAMGQNTTASGEIATALGVNTIASGDRSTALGVNTIASGERSTAIGVSTNASGENSISMGQNTISNGYASTVVGMYNNPVLASPQTTVTSTTPLWIVGNGNDDANRSNAMIVLKNGSTGIGTDVPTATLHIKHAAGGGLLLENANDGNKWRIYSASGDNHLTFYNNAGTEIADIDDATGTFNALSDIRYKKNIQNMKPVLPLLMQLRPAYYHFNWQAPTEQLQLGMLAQEAHQLFPELVSYNKTADVYKMNYAGFSTVAIKAIQEQQIQIQKQQKQIDELTALVKQLLNK